MVLTPRPPLHRGAIERGLDSRFRGNDELCKGLPAREWRMGVISVVEQPHSRQRHHHTVFVAGGDDRLVAERAARLG